MTLGGGVLIAFAAVLWLLYLAPAWLQRRRYLATERTAVRLQQTLRILAETADVPDEVRAEVSARSVAEQHRLLREAARRAESAARSSDVAAERSLTRRRRAPREPQRRTAAVHALTAARLRRSRLLAAALLVGSLGITGYGVAREVTGHGWLLTAAGGIGALSALALLQRAATVAAAHRAMIAVDRAVQLPEPQQSFDDWQAGEAARPTWTPVPLAAEPQRERQPEAPRLAPVAVRMREVGPATEAVHVALGIQDTQSMLPDVDAVLRRRRAG